MTIREYVEEIQGIVTEAISECDSRDEEEEYIHKTVYWHKWVIYTASAIQVLAHSPNDSYATEELGVSVDAGEPVPWSMLAYGAMLADCHQELARRDD